MNKRNLEYENTFKSYLYKGDLSRFKAICESLNIDANLNGLRVE